MTMHVVWYTAMSMDGRIANPHHSLDFLSTIEGGDNAASDFQQFLSDIEAVLIGASTLRWLLREGHGWPHDDLPTWLVSHDPRLVEQVGPTRAPIVRVEGDLTSTFGDIESMGHQRLWICGGGNIAGQALAIDRIDEVIVTIAPTALGAGPSLFDAPNLPQRKFTLAECVPLGNAARLRWLRSRP